MLYSHRCTIGDAVVNPAFQRLGIASSLFSMLQVCKRVKIQVCTYNLSGNGTENFYKSLGMKECGCIPNGIFEPWVEQLKYDEEIMPGRRNSSSYFIW